MAQIEATADVPDGVTGHTWATSTELGGARGSVGCLDVQSPVLCALSPEGIAVWKLERKFSLWTSQRSRFRKSGGSDVLINVPDDGVDNEGWRENWLGSVGEIG